MASPYSKDLRKVVVKLMEEGERAEEVAEELGVSRRWVYRVMKRYREEGSLEAKPMGNNLVPKLAGHVDELRRLVKDNPDATIKELREMLSIQVSHGALFNMLRREGITLKKSRLRA